MEFDIIFKLAKRCGNYNFVYKYIPEFCLYVAGEMRSQAIGVSPGPNSFFDI